MISLSDPSFLQILVSLAEAVLVVVLASMIPSNSSLQSPEINRALVDDDTRIKKLIEAHNSLFTDVSDLKASGLPKGFYDNINLDNKVEDLRDEELDSEIHSLDEIQEQNARAMIILNRNYKALEARRVAAHKVRNDRDVSNLPQLKPKTPTEPKAPQEPNPFPFLEQKA